MRFFQKKTIYGCDARGDAESAYLTRYTLIAGRLGQLCLHVFHRSDADELHDHPWSFWTLILWRGYREHTPGGYSQRIYPGRILCRPAGWAHRVELVNERKAVTLVWMGRRERDWGFFTDEGWKFWKRYFTDKGC